MKTTRCFGVMTLIMWVILVVSLTFVLAGCVEATDPSGQNNNGDGDNGGGNGGGNVHPTITIKNDTGFTISNVFVKAPTATSWGSDLLSGTISNGGSRAFTLSQPLSAQSVYDIRLTQQSNSGGYNYRKYMFTVSNGMTITFTPDDLNDGSSHPSITIQNRSGVSYSGIHIKPSVSTDWGGSLGTVSNNSNETVSIPIPPSSYTVFDFQMRSSNPTNTYTRNNVSVFDGLVLLYTSADSDNPLSGHPIIVIQNHTGFTVYNVFIKQPMATSWGSDLLSGSISNGGSYAFTLSQPLSAQSVYDIRLTQQSNSGGYNYRKYMFTVSNGMIITFTPEDLNDGSSHPSVTIQNRSGVSFSAIHIKPSVSSDWGTSFGTISNNSNDTVTIPIPPTSYTVFDFQMRSSNPTNTYTRYSVTVSDGLVLMYTSADSDNPLTGHPIIVIKNDTGFTVYNVYMKAPSATSWGSDMLSGSISNGGSLAFTLSQPLSAQSVYDIRLTQNSNGGGNNYIKTSVSITDGMIIIFTPSDLN